MEEKKLGTVEKVMLVEQVISQASNVGVAEMRSHLRTKAYAEARQVVWFILHDHTGLSFPEIAEIYQRNHTTIMHGCRRIRQDKTKAADRIIAAFRKLHPELLEGRPKGAARTVDKWQF
jgi:chromosomal replication initiator protein